MISMGKVERREESDMAIEGRNEKTREGEKMEVRGQGGNR